MLKNIYECSTLGLFYVFFLKYNNRHSSIYSTLLTSTTPQCYKGYIKKVRHLFNHKSNRLFLNTKTIYKKGLYANFISSIDAPDAEACIKARDNLKSAINGAISSRLNFWSSSSSRRRKRTSTKCSSTSMLDICPDFSMNCALKTKN